MKTKKREIRGWGRCRFAAAVAFLGVLQAFPMEWTARPMTITSVSRHPIGTVRSVDLAFGADNGSTNRLYVAIMVKIIFFIPLDNYIHADVV